MNNQLLGGTKVYTITKVPVYRGTKVAKLKSEMEEIEPQMNGIPVWFHSFFLHLRFDFLR